MNHKKRTRTAKAGLPPGSLIHIGEKKVEKVSISIIEYTETSFSEKIVQSMEECSEAIKTPSLSWINMVGLHEAENFRQIEEAFLVHPLVLEDIMNTAQRPRVEDYGDYIYIVLKMIYHDPSANKIITEQVSFILGTNYLISFQEVEGDIFAQIRERIRTSKGRLRKSGPDYLAYCLLDAIIDNYFVVLDEMGEKIDELQDQVLDHPTPEILARIHRTKREMIFLRKAIRPVRELVNSLLKSESMLISDATDVFLRDVYEHSIQVIEITETLRDMLSSALDIYLSSTSNRMNEVMRVLTVISTLFIPLTFMVGIYGMNFEYMPELKFHYGYAALWVLMGVTALGMILFFRNKKWL